MKTKVSQAGERIMIGLRRRKLRNSFLPILLCCISREISSASKDGKRGLKRLDCGSHGEIVRRCDVDEESKDFVDASTRQAGSVDGFVVNVRPFLKVETDSTVVVREGRIVSKDGTPKSGRGGTADDVADLMKRDGWFHLIEIEVKCRRTSVKVEVKQED